MVAFLLEHAIDDGDVTPGSLGNALPDVEVVSVVPSVLVPVGHKLLWDAEGEVRFLFSNKTLCKKNAVTRGFACPLLCPKVRPRSD